MTKAKVLMEIVAKARQAQKEIRKTGREMKQNLQQDLRSNLDIEDEGEIRKKGLEMRRMARDRRAKIKPTVDKKSQKKTQAKLRKLKEENKLHSLRDSSNLSDKVKFDSQGMPYEPSTGHKMSKKKARKLTQQHGDLRGFFGPDTKTGGTPSGLQEMRDMFGVDTSEEGINFSAADSNPIPDAKKETEGLIDYTDQVEQAENRFTGLTEKVENMGEGIDLSKHNMNKLAENSKKFGKNFKKYSPNIMMWWKVVALLLPMMIALKVQAMGVKIALQSIAAAGAAMTLGGLLGHGEGIEDSMALMERRINELKRELFREFRPLLQEFAPISERFLSTLTNRLQPLIDTLSRLTEFEGAFFRLFDDLIAHVDRLGNFLMDHAREFEQVGRRFLSIVVERGERFLDFLFTTMVQEQDAMIRMINVFSGVVGTIWNILKLASQIAAVFHQIFTAISWVTGQLSSKFVAALAIATVAGYAMLTMLNSLLITKYMIATITWGSWASAIVGNISKVIGALSALKASYLAMGTMAKWAWAMATIGASLAITSVISRTMGILTPDVDDFGGGAGGHPSGSGRAGGSPTYNTTINVDGEMSSQQRRKIENIARDIGSERDEIENDRGM